MSKRKRAVAWIVPLLIVCVAIIWHVVHWHSTGMYLNMTGWVGTDKSYITVLYNLGLMVLLGVVIGFLMERTTDLIDDGSTR